MKLKNLAAVAVLLVFMTVSAFSCDFSLDIKKGKKKTYSTGDVITLVASLEFTHDPCNHELENIRLVPVGATIISEGKWILDDDDDDDDEIEYEKKIKIKITAKKDETASLQIVRNCNRGGDSEKRSFIVK